MVAQKYLVESLRTPTPFMLTDLGIIREHCRLFKKLFPGIRLFYAMKAFPDLEVLKVMATEVEGFDAASFEEIATLLSVGVDSSRIAFNNPVKVPKDVEKAIQVGVRSFSFQSKEELQKIAKYQKTKVNVFVRTKMDDSHSVVPLSTKYGCSNKEVIGLLEYASDLGLNPEGITFHVGSQQTGLEEWSKAIAASQNLVVEARERGLSVKTINLGGGFPANYGFSKTTIAEVAQEVNNSLDHSKNISYMAEPGRYLVAESSTIITSVIGVEQREGKKWLFLDTGIFQAFAGALRFDPFPYPPFCLNHPSSDSSDQQAYTLTGPSCDSQDVFPGEMLLPKDIKIGDRLIFPNCGAYTVVYGSNFNGFKVPPRIFVDSSKEGV